jgi:hypothetical protein
MSSKNIKQCTICEQWFCRNIGGFMKHIWTCQQQVSLQSLTDKNALDHQILCSLLLQITSHLRLTMTVTFTVITPLTKQILKSTTTSPSQMVIASSRVIMIFLCNITLYTIIHKMKRTLFAIILHNDPMQGIDFR